VSGAAVVDRIVAVIEDEIVTLRELEARAAPYLEQLQGIGSLEFECKGRECGSSSYWANKIFKSAMLYGPEQFQSYAVFRTSAGWWTVYIGQRATRKIYARLDHYSLGEKAD